MGAAHVCLEDALEEAAAFGEGLGGRGRGRGCLGPERLGLREDRLDPASVLLLFVDRQRRQPRHLAAGQRDPKRWVVLDVPFGPRSGGGLAVGFGIKGEECRQRFDTIGGALLFAGHRRPVVAFDG